ncbi:metallophosphoesterase [Candidatus Woesearchaeota archaeon]|nr:metallophosphoesterase [Candidatus Woesearchaeota archaeon]
MENTKNTETIEQELISTLFEKGILVNKEVLHKKIEQSLTEKLQDEQDLLVLNEDYLQVLYHDPFIIDWYEMDYYRVAVEKERDDGLYQSHLQKIQHTTLSLQSTSQVSASSSSSTSTSTSTSVEIPNNPISHFPEKNFSSEEDFLETTISLKKGTSLLGDPLLPRIKIITPQVSIVISHQNIPKDYEIKDFTSLFISRYHYLESILRQRQELQQPLPIHRILQKKEKETVSFIGLVQEKNITKNGNLLLKIEDPTGIISLLVSKEKKELFALAKDLVLDEVVGIQGMHQGTIVFAEQLVWPDIPVGELKKGEKEEYAIFLSDLHIGSKLFLREPFQKFLEWLKGNLGNEQQKAVAQKVKYILISGDVVDGVGIYPSQEEELAVTDIKAQYHEVSSLLNEIPHDKQIIMCPGNHDVVHLAEPQPAFYKEYIGKLTELPHVTLVSNPSLVTIGKTPTFSGFDVILYHGYSFDYYVANVDSIRLGGGYHRADLIMKFLLKRRHLAPTFRSTPYYPGHKEDPLLIKKIPDFFATGHIHYCCVANYKGVTLISGSCWQDKTSFQEKLGHDPEPARVPLVNLKTRETKIMRFQ